MQIVRVRVHVRVCAYACACAFTNHSKRLHVHESTAHIPVAPESDGRLVQLEKSDGFDSVHVKFFV